MRHHTLVVERRAFCLATATGHMQFTFNAESQNINIKYRSHFCSGKYRICEVNIFLLMPNNFRWKTLIHPCEGTLMRKVFRTEDATYSRGKIRLIEGNAKCRHLKKLAFKGTLRQVFVCLRPRTQYPYPPLTHCIPVYIILIHTQRGGGGGGKT
jgi:hypothetical protein